MVNTSSAPRLGTATRRATYLNGLVALVVGIAIVTATSQAHHHYDPKAASGWRELPTYVISGLIGYGIAFGLGLLRVRRSGTAKTMAWTALVLAVLGVVLFPVAWWTPIPFVFGAAAVLLGVDANAAAGRSRLSTAGIVLGWLAILATVVLFAYRIIEVLNH
jgi:hypothetical protein